MKNLRQTSKPRGYQYWIIRIVFFFGLPVLFYYGYCWGLWGRHSLLLQYFFQCNCPPVSTNARYPKQVDVIIPACKHISSRLSPSGNFLYIREGEFRNTTAYLLDLRTGQRIEVTNIPFSSFLTDDLWLVEGGIEDHIIDRITGRQYPIKTFRHWQENSYMNGTANLELLISALHQAKKIFFTQNNDIVVVLMSDFPTNLEQNFTFNRIDIPGVDSNRVEKFLLENKVDYQTVLADFPDEAVSPNGRFVARADGIYLVESGQKIVDGYSASIFYRPYSGKYFSVRGWTENGKGVIYSMFLEPCLIESNFLFGDDPGCYFKISQPILKLKLPQEYLSHTQAP